jgi:hypothetical protein
LIIPADRSFHTPEQFDAVGIGKRHGIDLFDDAKTPVFERNILVAFPKTIKDLLQPVGLTYRKKERPLCYVLVHDGSSRGQEPL